MVATVTDSVYKYIGPVPAILGTAFLTLVILIVTRNLRIASTFAVVIATTWLSMALVKLLVHRARPDGSVLSYPYDPAQVDASYPSGHTAFITALVVTLFLAVSVGYRRWLVGILGGLIVVGVGVSLVTAGVHYPSDVLGSVVWAITVAPLARLAWVSLVIRPIDRYRSRRANPPRHVG
jgi:undecaprenyl-diphosphatase